MRKEKRRTILVISALIFSGLAVLGFFAWHVFLENGLYGCGNEILAEVRSPDGKYIAAWFERNCGATTRYQRLVSIRPSGNSFDKEGVDDAVFSVEGQPQLNLLWNGPRELLLQSDRCDALSLTRRNWNDVSIDCSTPK